MNGDKLVKAAPYVETRLQGVKGRAARKVLRDLGVPLVCIGRDYYASEARLRRAFDELLAEAGSRAA